jgi:hypothetical protein
MKINRILITISSLLLIYTIIGFIAIPKIAKPQIENIINENITQKATIEKIHFNPFLFKFSIDNLKIADKNKTTFSLKSISIDFSALKSIDKKHIHFKILKIVEPYINIIENPDGSFNLEKLLKQAKTQQPKQQKKESSSSDIKFQIFKTVIKNAQIDFTKIISDKTPYKISIHNFNYTFYDMGTFKNALASHTLEMKINKESTLAIKGGLRLNPFEMYGNVEIEKLKPKEFLDYKDDMLNFDLNKDSFINLSFGYKVNMIKDLKIEIDHANLALNNLNIKKENKKLLDLKSLNIDDLNLDYPQNIVNISSITFNKISSNIKSDKNGNLNLNDLVKNQEQSKEENKEETKPWQVKLKEFNIKNSDLTFNDLKNSLNVSSKDIDLKLEDFKLKDEKITLKNLNLSKVDLSFKQNRQTEIEANDISFDTQNFGFAQKNIELEKAIFSVNSINIKEKKSSLDIKTKGLRVEAVNNSFVNEKVDIYKLLFKNSFLSMIDRKNNQTVQAKNINLTVDKISQKENELKIAKSLINKPELLIKLGKKIEEKQKEKKEEKVSVKENKKSDFKFDIGPVKINNMKMSFEDKNLPIPFKTNITELNGQFSRLNSTTSEPTKLNLEGKVDKYGYTKITGRVDINDIKLLTDTNLLFKNIAIKNFTPYSGKFVGRAIDEGKLNLDLKYNIKKSNLNAQNSIVISDIKLGKNIESKEAVNLPLELAIALLEDSSGVIDIDLPITGNVDDPQFSIAPIVWKAFVNLIVKAVASPFTLLGSLFNIDEEKLKAIEFEYGKSNILTSEKESLDAIGKILKEKNRLAIKLQPVYDPNNDKFALQKSKFEKVLEKQMKNYKDTDQYKKALEELYKNEKEDKSLDEIKEDFVNKDKNSKEVFDIDNYLEYLKNALASKQEVKNEELISLVKERIQNIKEYLKTKDIPKNSLIIEDIKEQASNDKKWIKLKLEVSAK